MKILIVVDNEFDNDIRVQRQCNMLSKQGFDLVVLCYDQGSIYRTYEQWKVMRCKISKIRKSTIMPLENRFKTLSKFWFRFIHKTLLEFKPNLVIAHDLYMAKPTRTAIAKSRIDAKLLLDLHENYPYTINTYGWTQNKLNQLIVQPKRWKVLEKEYLQCADGISFLSQSFREEILNRYSSLSKERTIVLPNVPDVDYLESQNLNIDLLGPSEKGTRVLYFGLIAKRRGIFDLIEVLSDTIDGSAKFELVLIGPVEKNDKLEFHRLISADKLKNRITYIPWIDISELMSVIASVDICVSPLDINPQHESGIANKIFQYMYGGKPLIVSNCKPQAELVLRTECGFVYKSLSEFRELLIALEGDSELRIRLGENGRRAVKTKYNLDYLSKSYIDFINKISVYG